MTHRPPGQASAKGHNPAKTTKVAPVGSAARDAAKHTDAGGTGERIARLRLYRRRQHQLRTSGHQSNSRAKPAVWFAAQRIGLLFHKQLQTPLAATCEARTSPASWLTAVNPCATWRQPGETGDSDNGRAVRSTVPRQRHPAPASITTF